MRTLPTSNQILLLKSLLFGNHIIIKIKIIPWLWDGLNREFRTLLEDVCFDDTEQ